MATSSLDEYRIPKLNTENYYAWSIRARAALVQKKIWDSIDPGYGPTMTSDEREKNERALTFLFLIVEDSYLDDIGQEIRAKDAWEILKKMNTSRGLLHKLTMLKEFVKIEKTPDETMQSYISRFAEKLRQIQACGFGFNEREAAGLLLAGLPSRYEMFVTSNFHEDGDDLEMKTVKTKLLMEEKRISHQDNIKENKVKEERETMQALAVTRDEKQIRRNSKREKGRDETVYNARRISASSKGNYVKCYTCNNFGHIAKECPQYLKFQREEKVKHGKRDDDKVKIAIHQALMCKRQEKNKRLAWILDSGATDHMSSYRDKFEHFEEYEAMVEIANGESMTVKGMGSMVITLAKPNGGLTLKIEKVLYVPELDGNLLSIGRVAEKGLKVNFQAESAIIINEQGTEVIRAIKQNALYAFYENETPHKSHVATTDKTQLWHRRLGHLHIKAVKKIEEEKQLIIELPNEDSEMSAYCETCIEGKMRKRKFPKGQAKRATEPLEIIHSDIAGRIQPMSRGGSNYFITFIDDYSRFTTVYFLKTKDEALETFKKYKQMAETQHKSKIKCIRSDNGGEYTSREFDEYLIKEGIVRQLTIPYTPEQNGIAERMNQTLVDMARCMMIESGISINFWADAINTACYIRNKCPSRSVENNIPEELWRGREVDLNHLRVFGSRVWALTNDVKRSSKFDPKAKECIMIGYSTETKGYKLWNWKEDYIFMSRNVRFDETTFPLKKRKETTNELKNTNEENELILTIENEFPTANDDVEPNASNSENSAMEHKSENEIMRPLSLFEDASDADYNIDRAELPLPTLDQRERRSERIAAKNDFQMKCSFTQMNEMMNDIPLTTKEALSGKEADHWKKSMNEEIENLQRCDTWELVRRPKDKKVIGSKWVYRKKTDERGNLTRYKARLVAQGFSQTPGIDFNETYSPVVKMRSLRFLISLIVELGWNDIHIDVVSAYVNSELSESVYIEQPEGFIKKNKEDWVLLLKKALYGLHQSGKEWNRKLDAFLKGIGLKRSAADPCIYFDPTGELVIGVYVDDIAAVGITEKLMTFVKRMEEKFKIKNLGKITHLLSIKINRPTPDCITLDQSKYAQNILKTFGMDECRGAATPLDPGTNLSKEMKPNEKMDYPYRQLIGSLLYLAGGTRPDLSFAVTYLSQFNDCATEKHWIAAKHVLRYLNRTSEIKIIYSKTGEKMSIYVDSDWASDKVDRRSWTGYVIQFAGSVISWRSKKQKTVALSTAEAEYIAMCEVAKEMLWWRNLLEELGLLKLISERIEIRVDNQGAIAMARKWETSDRSKHIDLRYYFLRELVENGKIFFKYIPTNDNLADMFTKKISGKKMTKHLDELNVNMA